jgi:hypothetical protein
MPQPLRFRRRWPGILAGLFILHVGFAASFALWFMLALSPLQKQYFPTYLAIGMTGRSVKTVPVWWIWKTGPKRKPLFALDADVVSAKAASPKELPLALSQEAQAAGWTGLVRTKRISGGGSPGFFRRRKFGPVDDHAALRCGTSLSVLRRPQDQVRGPEQS